MKMLNTATVLLGATVIAIGLSACSTAKQHVSSGVAAAVVSLTEAERLALIYTGLPRCPQSAPACSDPAVVQKIKDYDNRAYSAVKAAEGNEGLLAAALVAVQSLQAAIPAR